MAVDAYTIGAREDEARIRISPGDIASHGSSPQYASKPGGRGGVPRRQRGPRRAEKWCLLESEGSQPPHGTRTGLAGALRPLCCGV
jgi:hypothetical protein